METDRIAAGLIAGGVLLAAIAGISTPAGLYQEPDFAQRLRIIADQGGRFVLAQALWAAMLAVPAVGFLLLGSRLSAAPPWLTLAAAAAIVAGALAGIAFVALQTIDPERFWLAGGAVWLAVVAAWLTVAAAGLYGVALLAEPGWSVAGYILVAFAALGAGALLMGAPAFFVTAAFYLAALAPATVLLRA